VPPGPVPWHAMPAIQAIALTAREFHLSQYQRLRDQLHAGSRGRGTRPGAHRLQEISEELAAQPPRAHTALLTHGPFVQRWSMACLRALLAAASLSHISRCTDALISTTGIDSTDALMHCAPLAARMHARTHHASLAR
jgi:hypothetical protein